jgi:hypothetical protein
MPHLLNLNLVFERPSYSVTICTSRRIKGIARTLLRGTHYQGLHWNRSYPSHARAFDRRCCTSQAGAFSKDGAPNKAQRRRAFGGCGRWHLIPDTANDRTTWVEGIGQGQKRGWSVVCESACKSKGAVTGRRSADFFFFLKIPGHQVAALPRDR